MIRDFTAISLFVCATYAFTFLVKALLDARSRTLIARDGGNADLLRELVVADALQRRLAALRWGIALCAIAVGFGLIELFGWREITPGVVAVLAGSAGVGQLLFYVVSARTNSGTPPR